MVTFTQKPELVRDITDGSSNEANQDRRAAAHVGDNDTAQTVLSTSHALAERLTAVDMYFAAARRKIANRDYKAAEELIQRVLDQSDQVRKIAEQLRASLQGRLP